MALEMLGELLGGILSLVVCGISILAFGVAGLSAGITIDEWVHSVYGDVDIILLSASVVMGITALVVFMSLQTVAHILQLNGGVLSYLLYGVITGALLTIVISVIIVLPAGLGEVVSGRSMVEE